MLTLFLVLSFVASMTGGLAPAVEQAMERLGLERFLSFRSGLLIAAATFDILPEAWHQYPPNAGLFTLGALGLGWFLHHGHGEDHEGHEHTHPHVHGQAPWPVAACALFLHSFVDGINLGSIAFVGGPALFAAGAATSVHKLTDGLTLTSLFSHTGQPRTRVLALLLAVSLATPIGAILGRAGAVSLGPTLTGALLGFAGGSFLYVGLAQIIPHLWRKRDFGCAVAATCGCGFFLLLNSLSF